MKIVTRDFRGLDSTILKNKMASTIQRENFFKKLSNAGVEGMWRGSSFVPVWLGTGSHKFPGLDKVMLTPKGALRLTPAKTVLRGSATFYESDLLMENSTI